MAVDLTKTAKEKGIKYFFISYVDLFGVLRAKLVPARASRPLRTCPGHCKALLGC